ncbi:hypothetical protein LCGC14_2329860 [marine sediment metagenome]|uniref:Uncharacterized protein n=1 Tax=marine sediment metagenome TaxID=412755 RepID=A0A0F9CF55_9ZZZZ
MTFDQHNTDGYTDDELTGLNDEFNRRFNLGDWPTTDKDLARKWFADEVAKR